MKIRGLVPILFLTLILGAVLAFSTFFSDAKIPRINLSPENILEDASEEEDPKDEQNGPSLRITNSSNVTHTINIEIADTPEKRALGLMNRKKLDQDAGMLFIYGEEGLHGFWMKDTLIPLDLVHINDNEVVEIIENMQPCDTNTEDFALCPSYPASTRSKYSLEINAGRVEELNIKVGDKVEIDL